MAKEPLSYKEFIKLVGDPNVITLKSMQDIAEQMKHYKLKPENTAFDLLNSHLREPIPDNNRVVLNSGRLMEFTDRVQLNRVEEAYDRMLLDRIRQDPETLIFTSNPQPNNAHWSRGALLRQDGVRTEPLREGQVPPRRNDMIDALRYSQIPLREQTERMFGEFPDRDEIVRRINSGRPAQEPYGVSPMREFLSRNQMRENISMDPLRPTFQEVMQHFEYLGPIPEPHVLVSEGRIIVPVMDSPDFPNGQMLVDLNNRKYWSII